MKGENDMDFSLITQELLDYCVYAHINKLDRKMYIGITNNISNRWSAKGEAYNGCTHFYSALQKYGWDNFIHIIILDNIPFSIACEIEKGLIAKYNTIKNGYNLKAGGAGGGALRDKHYRSKPIYQYDLGGNFIRKWDCPIDAEKYYGINDITRSANGVLSSAAGFQWSYEYADKINPYANRSNHRYLPIYQYDIDGNLIKKWDYFQDAINKYGECIRYCAYGQSKTSAGYRWSFKHFDELPKIQKPKYKRKGKNKYERSQKVYKYDLCGNLIQQYENCAAINDKNINLDIVYNLCMKNYQFVYKDAIWIFEDSVDNGYVQDTINLHNKKHPKVYQYDLDGRLIKIFNRMADVENTGYNRSCIIRVCKGVGKTAYGYIWKYNNDNGGENDVQLD